METEQNNLMEKIVSLTKRRGFIFPSSEIYGGTGSVYDFGPYGVELKRNLKELFWQRFVRSREDMVGIDAGILMKRDVWVASGHEKGFVDPLVECKKCHQRFREDEIEKPGFLDSPASKCPEGGNHELMEAKQFNLLFKTFMGPSEDSSTMAYLRGETAQGIFVNFKNVLDSSRKKIPFGIAQIGKAFRNEITPGNFIFRTREFEQGEIEYFVKPKEADEKFEEWLKEWKNLFADLGLNGEKMRIREHEKDELAHYSKRTVDIEYNFPFGWSELAGVANRTDFDLKQHAEHSGKDLQYFDEQNGKKYFPYIIEPTMGIDRAMLAVIVDAYSEEKVKEEKRVVLKLKPSIAPVKAAILPLVKKDKDLVEIGRNIYDDLHARFVVEYDAGGSIGRRYRRQDEIGTPFCITIDGQSLKDKTVTVRDRDTLKQDRVKVTELAEIIQSKLI